MPASLKMIAVAVALVATLPAASDRSSDPADSTEIVAIPPGTLNYRLSGEFLRDGIPVNAPLQEVVFDAPIAIMQRQVSRAEYERCVTAKACKPLAKTPGADAGITPAVGVSWYDANAYAAWLSRETGHRYRLPSDAEWVQAAGGLLTDDAIADNGDASNPARRWIAEYERESASGEASDPAPKPFGSFGTNRRGLLDIGGNVWEWTDTCYTRQAESGDGSRTVVESCGVRVVEGRHRAYMTDFIRDPSGGACSAGAPPSNLGIRLVRDDG
jgi:formylglycine-generating enzyme required for sulfatase activity